jgi:hypothetical protein
MEPRGRRASRASEPAEITTPMVEPDESTSAATEPVGYPGEFGVEAATISAAPQTTPPIALDQIEAAPPEAPLPLPVAAEGAELAAPPDELVDFGREARFAVAEARSALADGFEALSDEVAALARRGIDTTARTAIEMLAIRTVADAAKVNAGFARANVANWVASSAKFAELGIRLGAEPLRPLLDQLGKSWMGICRAGF